jgi:hypothetical protein
LTIAARRIDEWREEGMEEGKLESSFWTGRREGLLSGTDKQEEEELSESGAFWNHVYSKE